MTFLDHKISIPSEIFYKKLKGLRWLMASGATPLSPLLVGGSICGNVVIDGTSKLVKLAG